MKTSLLKCFLASFLVLLLSATSYAAPAVADNDVGVACTTTAAAAADVIPESGTICTDEAYTATPAMSAWIAIVPTDATVFRDEGQTTVTTMPVFFAEAPNIACRTQLSPGGSQIKKVEFSTFNFTGINETSTATQVQPVKQDFGATVIGVKTDAPHSTGYVNFQTAMINETITTGTDAEGMQV